MDFVCVCVCVCVCVSVFQGQGNSKIFKKTIRGKLYKTKTQSKLYKTTIHGKTNVIITVGNYYYYSVYIKQPAKTYLLAPEASSGPLAPASRVVRQYVYFCISKCVSICTSALVNASVFVLLY